MGYAHFSGISVTKDGIAVGAKGAEVGVIDMNRKVTATSLSLGGTDITATAAQINATKSYMVVQARKASVAASQSDVEVFEFTAPAALTLAGVQVYCTATAATALVNVKEAGTSVLSAAVTPSAGAVVAGTISDSAIANGAAVTVHVTTDATGSITDLTVTLIFKAEHVS